MMFSAWRRRQGQVAIDVLVLGWQYRVEVLSGYFWVSTQLVVNVVLHSGPSVSQALSGETQCLYPACIRVQKPPPDPIFPYFLHLPAAIEKYSKHPLP